MYISSGTRGFDAQNRKTGHRGFPAGRRTLFYEIRNAPFARNLSCTVRLDVRSCFLMAGGNLLPGREDNEILRQKLPQIDRLYSVFSEYRTIWNKQIGYIQKISSSEEGEMKADCSVNTGEVQRGGESAGTDPL